MFSFQWGFSYCKRVKTEMKRKAEVQMETFEPCTYSVHLQMIITECTVKVKIQVPLLLSSVINCKYVRRLAREVLLLNLMLY